MAMVYLSSKFTTIAENSRYLTRHAEDEKIAKAKLRNIP